MAALVALALVIALGPSSCGGEPEARPEPVPERVAGLIVELDADGDAVRGFVIETEGGERYDVRIDPEIDYGFDLAHLREHQQLEQPVDVALEQREDEIYATEILDA